MVQRRHRVQGQFKTIKQGSFLSQTLSVGENYHLDQFEARRFLIYIFANGISREFERIHW